MRIYVSLVLIVAYDGIGSVRMASRKEDEKNERIIRGLLKLPENRRCINCNSLVHNLLLSCSMFVHCCCCWFMRHLYILGSYSLYLIMV